MKKSRKQRSAGKGDVNIGALIRMRRIEKKISQAELGEQLGVSFQQIQKYEKGVNRVGGVRLLQIATALDCPITFFYDGAGNDGGTGSTIITDFMTSSDGMAIAKAWAGLPEGALRTNLRRLIESVAAASPAQTRPRLARAA